MHRPTRTDVSKTGPITGLPATVMMLFATMLAGLVTILVAAPSWAAVGDTPAVAAETGVDAEGAETGGELVLSEEDELLILGAAVYSQVCSSCHQPGGAGLPGQFPPLVSNPNVDDTDYLVDTIINGRRGRIEVLGDVYDGVMPSFSTLSDEELDAVVAYVQNDFMAPQVLIEAAAERGPVAGTELPALSMMSASLAFLIFASAVAMVLYPRFASVNDRLSIVPWLDTWLKTAGIVVAVAVATVFVPNWALNTSAVAKLSRFGQDVVGLGLFTIGLSIVLGGLWYFHRESRI